jgi:hypothetical protein
MKVALTGPEHSVLAGAAFYGDTAGETAARYGWPVSRVKTARKSAVRKLGAKNLPHAVHLASDALAGAR